MSHVSTTRPSLTAARRYRNIPGVRGAMSRALAFTLVELLVVIGIIALLISLLLPALNGARAAANQIACVANMRQIATAMFAYLQDNHGAFPPVSSNYPTGRQTWSNYFCGAYLGAGTNAAYPAYRDGKVMRCPTDDRGLQDPTANNSWGNPSYMIIDGGLYGQGGSATALSFNYNETQVIGGVVQVHSLTTTTGAQTSVNNGSANFAAIYPRGENPLIVEGTTPDCYQNQGPAYVANYRVTHGKNRTLMNYISQDLSIFTVDMSKVANASLHYSVNPGISTCGSLVTASWRSAQGNYSIPYTPNGPMQTNANSVASGGYWVDFPYYTLQRDAGPLLKCALVGSY